MSGIASAASTMPGSVATFWSCSSDVSRAIASSSSASANTRAGTRMSARRSAGISQTTSSIRRRSDVENDPRSPDTLLLAQLEAMVGDRLHQRRRSAGPATDDGAQRLLAQDELGHRLRHEVF